MLAGVGTTLVFEKGPCGFLDMGPCGCGKRDGVGIGEWTMWAL